LAFLPLHAAGIYPKNGKDKVICLADYAISSYTPTLAALAQSQRPIQNIEQPVKILIVAQPNTPNAQPLPGTMKELAVIQKHTLEHKMHTINVLSIIQKHAAQHQLLMEETLNVLAIIQKHVAQYQMLTALTKTEATVDKVVSEMNKCSWVHFACHGVQDLDAPLKSGFLLQNGCLELSRIMSNSVPNADFAFLSACQTAAGDLNHPDEAIHLAAGILSAGYHSVVATMWSISDDDAPSIADAVYSYLLADKRPDSQKAAKALHYAVQSLCKRDNYQSFASWIPFIHMGV
jgi:CHAT domain-containing protein